MAGKCEVTGLAFSLNRPKTRRESLRAWGPSVDRVDPLKGYTRDNCRLVCWMYNAAKGVSSDEDVMTMARALVARQA